MAERESVGDSELARQLDAKYSEELCPVCNTRIDEYYLCACGAGSD